VIAPFEAKIEEFEQGAWVADIVSVDEFDGSFELPDGSVWTGTKVTERSDFAQYTTRVVGGALKLGTLLKDKYYSGSVALSIAVQDVAREAGETVGTVTPAVFLSTFQRRADTAAAALDSIANAFGQIWWIDRTGTLQMGVARDTAPEADGSRVASDVDASAVVTSPAGMVLGASFAASDPTGGIPIIRHIRWELSRDRFQVQIYGVPFLFRSPTQTKYACHYQAQVTADNGDGTVDVMVQNLFGVTAVPLLCGVPGSKVKTKTGEIVTLGFYGADPQKPYCVAMGQNTGATKQVARKVDTIQVTLDAPTVTAIASVLQVLSFGPVAPLTPPVTPSPTFNGTITSGSARLMVDDG
jgi:hypothetical protein